MVSMHETYPAAQAICWTNKYAMQCLEWDKGFKRFGWFKNVKECREGKDHSESGCLKTEITLRILRRLCMIVANLSMNLKSTTLMILLVSENFKQTCTADNAGMLAQYMFTVSEWICVLDRHTDSWQTYTPFLSDRPPLSWIIQELFSPNSSNSYSFICIPVALRNDWPAITAGKKKKRNEMFPKQFASKWDRNDSVLFDDRDRPLCIMMLA